YTELKACISWLPDNGFGGNVTTCVCTILRIGYKQVNWMPTCLENKFSRQMQLQ
ncbi:hypothetical protein MKX03_009170, partial [Papaver bracteatum]